MHERLLWRLAGSHSHALMRALPRALDSLSLVRAVTWSLALTWSLSLTWALAWPLALVRALARGARRLLWR
ncbi:hypothetical protein [Nonomuraea insulae]|uniref:Uncharacterized protein n=1 Tax=Nonomuraea insulae TaxID=1616787 RepID=A0ABW1CQZ7_9ACTN